MRSLTSAQPVTLQGDVEITDWITGAVRFSPTATDTSSAGDYVMNWLVRFADGSQMTFPTDGFIWGRVEPTSVTAPRLIVSLPKVKEHLGIKNVDRGRDARLLRYVQYVTPLIEERTGPIIPRVFDEWHDGGSNLIELYRRPSSGFGTSPVMTLVGASEYRGPIEYPLALVASPVFGSIYSVFLNADMGTLTRRTAGGATIAFMPGRECVHVIYQSGQSQTPDNVEFAALEAVRVAYEWRQQSGSGSRSIADEQETGPVMQYELTRLIRSMLGPTRRAPSFA
jgi:hypothetical protein